MPLWEENCPDWAVLDLASLGHVVKELDHVLSTDLAWSEAGAALNHRLGYYQEARRCRAEAGPNSWRVTWTALGKPGQILPIQLLFLGFCRHHLPSST